MTWRDREIRKLDSLANNAAASRRSKGAEYPVELYIVGYDESKKGTERFLYIANRLMNKEGLFAIGLGTYPNTSEYRRMLRDREAPGRTLEEHEKILLDSLASFSERDVEVSPVGIGWEGWTKELYRTREAKRSEAGKLIEAAKAERRFDAAVKKMAEGMEIFEYALVLEERHMANNLKHMGLFGNGMPSLVLATEYGNPQTISASIGRNNPIMIVDSVDSGTSKRTFVMDIRKKIIEIKKGIAPKSSFEESVARLLVFEMMEIDVMERNLTEYGKTMMRDWLNSLRKSGLDWTEKLFEDIRNRKG